MNASRRLRFTLEELERRDTPSFTAAAPFFNGFNDPDNIGLPDVIAVGDFDTDGIPDLAIGTIPISGVNPAVIVVFGDGAGGFNVGPTLPIPITNAEPNSISVYRDAATNQLSLAVALSALSPPGGGTVHITGNGDGTFNPAVVIDNTPSRSVATGLFNSDNLDDLVVITEAGTYQIFTQDAAGVFTQSDTNATGIDHFRIVTGDFDDDGNGDFAGLNSLTNQLTVYYGAGDGTIAQVVNTVVGTGLNDLASADFNQDGTDDFLIADGDTTSFHQSNTNRTVNAAGVAIPSLSTTPGSNVELLAVGDFNGDGIADAVAFDENRDLLPALNDGTGVFTADPFSPYPSAGGSGQPGSVVTSDFNNDGRIEFLSTNFGQTLTTHGQVFLNLLVPTTTTVISAPNPSIYGNDVTITATVAPRSGPGLPTGTVIFTIDGLPSTPITLVSGVATLIRGDLLGGSHIITAAYSGDDNFDVSTSPPVTQVVDPAPTTTTVLATPSPAFYGQNVTLTATVTGLAGPGATQVPTGSVNFLINGNNFVGTLVGNTATVVVSNLNPNTYLASATYIGDTNYTTSVGNTAVDVLPANANASVVAAPNPATFGDVVTLTATLFISGPVEFPPTPPTGTWTFTIGSLTVGPVAVTGNVTTVNVPGIPAGTFPVVANYSGDVNYPPRTANTTLFVNPAPSTTTLVAPVGAQPVGQPLTFVATVAGAGQNPAPTGTVNLVDALDNTILATGTLTSGSNDVTFVIFLSSGSTTLFADYLGDTNYLPSASAPATVYVDASPVLLAGSDNGGVICYFNSSAEQSVGIDAFGPGLTGVRPAAADFNRDGAMDVVAGSAPGDPSRVAFMDGLTGQFVSSFSPFGDDFTGGVFVAAGDINGDGLPDLAVSAGVGGGSRVRVFLNNGAGFVPLADFLGIEDANFRGGSRVALADVNNDGFADLLVAAGPGGGPRVAGYTGQALRGGAIQRLFNDFFAFDTASTIGAYIASGDVNNDGFADIIIGAGEGGAPRVSIFDGAALINTGQNVMLANFFAGPEELRGGIRVSSLDFNLDGFDDVSTGPGGSDGSKQFVFNGADLATGVVTILFERDPFPGLLAGIYPG